MVSFKRKPVKIPPPKFTPTDPNAPVYVIEQTLEYFVNYNDYLARLDFYNQKKFICELTGHSCLSYFDALEKEAKEARSVVVDFPEPTKEPILRCVQFSTTSRLDQLVDEVYNTIRSEFFVGEMLHARTRDQQRVRARVLQKIQRDTEYTYICELENNPGSHETYAGSELFRDRKNFNKMSVRTFIKFAANRDNWAGCPWLVKKEYLDKYPNIPTKLPDSLQDLYDNREREETPATPEPQRRRKVVKVEKVTMDGGDDLELMAVSPNTAWPSWHEEQTLKGRHLGKALSVWYFLNAYNELLVLSPINFDVYLHAITTNNVPVLAELFCAMLTQFVDPDEDILAIPFPSQYEPKRQKLDSEEPQEASDEEMNDEDEGPAAKYLSLEEDWMVRIGKRKFQNGGWQSLVVCTLHEALYMREWQDTIQRLLDKLAVGEPSFENATKAWQNLDKSEIVEILDIFAQVLHTGPALRQFMETKADESTKIRKARAELAKEQKTVTENQRVLRVKMHTCGDQERADLEKELNAANNQQRELTEKSAELGNQVLHNDCQRLRYLGKDRFYNRYWYMELNGVERPNLSETSSGYLMARLWVQGPLKEDLIHFNSESDARLNAFKAAHYDRIYNIKVAAVQRERDAHKAQRAKKAERKPVETQHHPVQISQPIQMLPVPQPAPQQVHAPMQTPQMMAGQAMPGAYQMPPQMYQPMRPMQGMQGMPMYYPQPMYLPQMPHYVQQGQFMPQGQQFMYMVPSTVNGVNTLVPVQMQQMPMHMQQMQHMQMQQMQQMHMQYPQMPMHMQQMPMQHMPMQHMPMQHMPQAMVVPGQSPMPVQMAPMQASEKPKEEVKEPPKEEGVAPHVVTAQADVPGEKPSQQNGAGSKPIEAEPVEPEATRPEPVEPAAATVAATVTVDKPKAEAAQDEPDVSMAEPESEANEPAPAEAVTKSPEPEEPQAEPADAVMVDENVVKSEEPRENETEPTTKLAEETPQPAEDPTPAPAPAAVSAGASVDTKVPAATASPDQSAEDQSERTVSPETLAQNEPNGTNNSDTEDDLPPLPRRQSVELVTASGLRQSVEGDNSIEDENDWRFYENEQELTMLLVYLLKSGPREGRLYDKLCKLEPYLRHGMRNRLDTKDLKWSNSLAKEKLGKYHH